MHYFSDEFIKGLETKSLNFQKKFYAIMDDIFEYMDAEENRRKFQRDIEENHTYNSPGNILYSSKRIFGGQCIDGEEFKQKIKLYILRLFDGFGSADAFAEASHIIVCVRGPKGVVKDQDMDFLKGLIAFERFCRGCSPALITTILDDRLTDVAASCFVTAMK